MQLKSQAALIGLINAVVSVPTMISYGPIIFQACPVPAAGWSVRSFPSNFRCILSLQTVETYQTGCKHHFVRHILCVSSATKLFSFCWLMFSMFVWLRSEATPVSNTK